MLQLRARLGQGAALPLPDRDSVSALLVLLRCGTPVEDALRLVPGLTPDRMLAAYDHLESARAVSVDAWRRIASEPSAHALLEHAEPASRLLPLATHLSLARGMAARSEEARRVVAEIAAEVDRVQSLVCGIETSLASTRPGDARGVDVGSQLYNPLDPGLYSNPFYLPDRVASLSPIRVRDLLGESRT